MPMTNHAIVNLVYPGVQLAVDRAIHSKSPKKFHKRLGVGQECPICPPLEVIDK